jgi:PAS domain S-box-containing protein
VKLSLAWKWLIVSLFVESMMLSVLVFRNVEQLSESLKTQTSMRLQEQATLLQSALVAPWLQMDYATIQAILEETTKMSSVDYLVALGNQSQVIASVGLKENAPLPPLEKDPFESASLQDHRFDTTVDVLFSGQKLGSVRIGISTLFYVQAREAMIVKSVFIAFVEILLSALLLLSFGRWTAKHMREFTQGANAIARGEYTKRLELGTDHDTQALAHAFNTMAQTIQERVIALEVANDAEKILLEEVGHQAALIGSLLDSIPDIIFFKDTKGVYLGCNPPFATLVSRTKEEIVGKTDYDIFDAKMADFFRENDRKMMEQGLARHNEEWVTYPDGRSVLLDTLKAPYLNSHGLIEGIIGISRDITERKRAEEDVVEARKAAEAANRVKSEFLANMSHEIRTPMNAILGLSEMALTDVPKGAGHDKLEKIYQSGRLLLGILNDILDFSKIEAGELTLNAQPFYFNKMLDQLKSLFSQTAKNKHIALFIEAPKDFEVVYRGDDLRLQQVLTNLIGNALKFTQKGEVRLRVREISSKEGVCWLSFAISDTGIGIQPEEQQRLFHAFSQANTSITRDYGGTGLGLIISQRLVWAMGGSDIAIKSEYGKGTTFSFGVPLHTCSLEEISTLFESRTEVHADVSDTLAGYILVVEDNLINQEVVCEQLRRMGMSSKVANNGLKAVVMVKEESFDAVLMDIQMPVMDGYEATKRIRLSHPQLPIIALTAAAMIEDQQKALLVGMNSHLSKPINAKELRDVLSLYVKHVTREETPPPLKPSESHKAIAILDATEGLDRMGGNKPLYVKLLRAFLEQLKTHILPELLAKKPLKRGKNAGEWEPFRLEVHSLKGLAGNLSLHVLLEAATQLDAQIKEKQCATKALVDALHVSLQISERAIGAWLEKEGSV